MRFKKGLFLLVEVGGGNSMGIWINTWKILDNILNFARAHIPLLLVIMILLSAINMAIDSQKEYTTGKIAKEMNNASMLQFKTIDAHVSYTDLNLLTLNENISILEKQIRGNSEVDIHEKNIWNYKSQRDEATREYNKYIDNVNNITHTCDSLQDDYNNLNTIWKIITLFLILINMLLLYLSLHPKKELH